MRGAAGRVLPLSGAVSLVTRMIVMSSSDDMHPTSGYARIPGRWHTRLAERYLQRGMRFALSPTRPLRRTNNVRYFPARIVGLSQKAVRSGYLDAWCHQDLRCFGVLRMAPNPSSVVTFLPRGLIVPPPGVTVSPSSSREDTGCPLGKAPGNCMARQPLQIGGRPWTHHELQRSHQIVLIS